MTSLLKAENLSLTINGAPILRSISFELGAGKTLGLVGESGSGKSMTAFSIMGLLPPGAKQSGKLVFDGEDLVSKRERDFALLRGGKIGMAFQEPMTALNPVQAIGVQVAEVFVRHANVTRAEALLRAAETLDRVGLSPAKIPLTRYPFELSGGQRQRVVIAMAVAMKPKLLIADEPTTALDVTTEAQILSLLYDLCAQDNTALLFVSHDLAAVARLSDNIAIMKDGEIVETGATATLFDTMRHPYSIALREASEFRLKNKNNELTSTIGRTVLKVDKVVRDYKTGRSGLFKKRQAFRAVNDVSFELRLGENIGIVGESGSGKSTLARAVLGLEPLDEGSIEIDGAAFSSSSGKGRRALRRKIQAVFQDPQGSFNPRHRVERIVAEPLHLRDERLTSVERTALVAACLVKVGLKASDAQKYPHEFSGGQRQRIAIARALIISPSIVVLDEATSALDVSVRAQILKLLAQLSKDSGISYLFVSHDLDVVQEATDRVLIMKSGSVVEQGPTEQIFTSPQHPYTRSLIEAKPSLRHEIAKRQEMERSG